MLKIDSITSHLPVTRGATHTTRLATAAPSTRRGQSDQIRQSERNLGRVVDVLSRENWTSDVSARRMLYGD